ncbi:hypothetical protein [Actinoplanes sp. L3-i22]|uniref:hypothetical protein n=1 Tax=Actinoplanes sp. L3-i22 TaxID=2836373 RepID=UPI001C77915D|nr:hypothetical protein [Actinoplanes sp. L3-i22]BCY13503.1 hypothetical protein L3i22_085910 [Actinoplanes sp. L3-i22]
MEKTLCFRCGGDVPGDQRWCGYCAAPVVTAGPPVPATSVPPTEPASAPLVEVASGPPDPGAVPGLGAGASAVRRKGLLVFGLVGVLLTVGGLVTMVAARPGDSPRGAAERYFDALADGDAPAALRWVASGSQLDTGQYPLLSDAALDADRVRPRDVEVGDDMAAGGQFGTAARSVRVVYRAGGQTVAQELVAVEESGEWRLRLPFVVLGVDGQRGRAVTVNGIGLGTAERVTVAFPGSYEAVAAGNTLLAESRATAVAQANGVVDYVAPLRFGVPELAGGARENIRGQVRTALDTCARSPLAQPGGCPFGLGVPGTNVAVTWSVATYPQVDVRTDSIMWFGGAAVQLVDDGTGKVHWSATYTDFSGAKKAQSGDTAFRLNGTAQATPTGIQVSLI